jgi:chaperonin GroES
MKSDRGLPSKQSFEPLANFLIKNKNAFGNMRPIADRVIIKPAPAEDKTKGGIIIPDTAKEKPQRGEVIAVGPGKDGNLMTVQVGDIVLYGKYSGQEIHYEGQDYLVMREEDILCIL